MPISSLKAAIETLLFMNHKPTTLNRLKELIDTDEEKVELEQLRAALQELASDYKDNSHGIEIVEIANGYQFRTKYEQRDLIHRLYQITPIKMSQAMLEVVSIIAYKQPITKEGIEKVRGVDCSHLIRTLMDKKLVRMVGRSDAPGKPMLYGTSKEFLELFGVRDLQSLPTLREIEEMLPQNQVGEEDQENTERALSAEMINLMTGVKELTFNDLELADFENEQTEANEKTKNPERSSQSHSTTTQHSQTGQAATEPLEAVPTTTSGP